MFSFNDSNNTQLYKVIRFKLENEDIITEIELQKKKSAPIIQLGENLIF